MLRTEVPNKVLKKVVSRKVLIINWSYQFVHCRHLICFLNSKLPDNDGKEFGAGFIRSKDKIMLDLKLVRLDNLKSRICS